MPKDLYEKELARVRVEGGAIKRDQQFVPDPARALAKTGVSQ